MFVLASMLHIRTGELKKQTKHRLPLAHYQWGARPIRRHSSGTGQVRDILMRSNVRCATP